MEIIGPASRPEVDEVVRILEIVADPKEAKKAAKELSVALAALEKAEAQNKARTAALDKKEQQLIDERAELEKLASQVESDKIANSDNLTAIKREKEALSARQKLAEKEDLRLQNIVADVQSREQAMAQREVRIKEELEREKQRHSDAAKEFQEKTAQLKKIMGA